MGLNWTSKQCLNCPYPTTEPLYQLGERVNVFLRESQVERHISLSITWSFLLPVAELCEGMYIPKWSRTKILFLVSVQILKRIWPWPHNIKQRFLMQTLGENVLIVQRLSVYCYHSTLFFWGSLASEKRITFSTVIFIMMGIKHWANTECVLQSLH